MIDVNQIQDKIAVPDNLKNAFERVTLAGMKVMFDKRTHKMMLDALQGDGALDDKLAAGIVQLMKMLFLSSNKTMPPQLMMPAAVYLMCEAFDFLQKSNPEATQEVLGSAMAKMPRLLMEGFGFTKEQISKLLEGQGQQPPQQAGGLIMGGANA